MNKKISKLLSALLFFIFFALVAVGKIYAGTDLTVSCFNNGPCSVSPASTPLFYEFNLYPGETRSQSLTITNYDTDDSCDLGLTIPDYRKPEGQAVDLQDVLFAAINDGSNIYGVLSGGDAQADKSYADLYSEHASMPLSLGTLAPGATNVFDWYATFDYAAGNEYQNVETVFDFRIAISCDGGSDGSDDGGGDDGGDDGGGTSPPGPASAPKCEDDNKFPNPPGSCSIVEQTANSVTLSWAPVNGASSYGIIFTDNQGGSYSALPNYVGNNTSYTINNLFGGRTYNFEIFAVGGNDNLCASPRCNASITATGGPVVGRPRGQGGEVLGVTEPSPSPSPEPSPSPTPKPAGEVLGTTACSTWKWYIPWILLLAQGVLILAADYYLRKDEKLTKHYVAVGITLASIVIFYLVRECNCYSDAWWFLAWLCKWYWVVSTLLTAILQAVNYAFIEETEPKDKDLEKEVNKKKNIEKKKA
ncbi:MAG: fibronectin type III domain-containing protein [Patescibacteria group bacterium]